MCIYSRLIKNTKYTPNKKNGGIVPAVLDNRVMAVPIGCGKCIECKKQKAREWQVRLLEDVRHNKNGKFITLTFSNESIKEINEIITKKIGYQLKGYELDNEIATIAIRRFLERWRKENKKSLRHWLITELGHQGTENIHMHGIIWTDKDVREIAKKWKYGYVWVGEKNNGKIKNYVNEKTVNYITKYVSKMDFQHKEYNPKILTSAGIGRGYMERTDWERNKYKEGETKETYKTRTGHEITMPIYLRNKIYTDEEKEKLWIEKLDKEVRWVTGRKIDVSKGDEEYWEAIKEARQKNERMGYGTSEVNWSRKKYEEERRTLLTQKRIENAPQALRGLGIPPESGESINDALSAWREQKE